MTRSFVADDGMELRIMAGDPAAQPMATTCLSITICEQSIWVARPVLWCQGQHQEQDFHQSPSEDPSLFTC